MLNSSPSERCAQKIAFIEKHLSQPSLIFLRYLAGSLVAGAFCGICFALLARADWKEDLIIGISFAFLFVICAPPIAQYFLIVRLAILRSGNKFGGKDLVKPQGILIVCSVLAVFLAMLLEASLTRAFGLKHTYNTAIEEIARKPVIKGELYLCDLVIQANPASADAYNLRGDLYTGLGEYKKAIEAYSEAIDLHPKFKHAYDGRARAYDRLGWRAEAANDHAEALCLDPEYYSSQGHFDLDMDDYTKAVNDYSEAVSLDPSFAENYVGRAEGYIGLKEYQKAVDDCNIAIRINNRSAYAHCCRGHAYDHLKCYSKAIDDFTATIAIDPQGGCYAARAYVYGEIGEYKQGIADCNRSISLHIKPVQTFLTRGILYRKAGQTKQSIDDYTEAIALDPKRAMSYDERASAYELLGENELASKDRIIADSLRHKTGHCL